MTSQGSKRETASRDRERTRTEIILVATQEFARHGFSGGRVDEIAARTRTTKRMIYYYFGSKRGLYLSVLEAAYEGIRSAEKKLDVTGLAPVDALRAIAESTYEHHTTHRDFIRLVATENIHQAENIRESEELARLNEGAVNILEEVLQRGIASGQFRKDVDALDLHMLISSYCVFGVANRYTFRTIFGRDMLAVERHERYRALVGAMAVAFMTDLGGPELPQVSDPPALITE
ncbi:TetR/AcrR family transcriptional regulator [Gryllotalpicola koreensis]|uniref:TetR/AcrR family transcriptional regulator n=1 Tax=Gryllotalpicola koreensis TaxID=993086 RepID=A0ABP8A2G3_9MICO